MPVVIHVTATDNEAYILAFSVGRSYRIAQIQSGNGFTVDATITLSAGTYVAPAISYGVLTNLSTEISTSIPAGTYTLCFFGLNWGGPANFEATVDGTEVGGAIAADPGVAWAPATMTITV